MKQLEGMILIETFVSWFLGVISNGIGEKSKRKREIKNLQDSTRQEVVWSCVKI